MKEFADCRLYGFVDFAYLDGREPVDLARALCEGGVDVLQLRAKGAGIDTVRRCAESLMPVVAGAGVRFVLNDHWKLGVELGVPCVHLGQEDFFGDGCRNPAPDRSAGAGARGPALGLSSHAPAEAERAVAAGADYVAVGPVFPTDTKPGRPAVTLDYVRWAARSLPVPWFAIGGIHLGNLDSVLEAGAVRVCVVSALLRSGDVRAACREFRRRLG